MSDQVPLMQQPGYVYRERKHVRADRIQVGDIVCETGRTPAEARWTVEKVEPTTYMTYLTYAGRRSRSCIGLNHERVWVERIAKD